MSDTPPMVTTTATHAKITSETTRTMLQKMTHGFIAHSPQSRCLREGAVAPDRGSVQPAVAQCQDRRSRDLAHRRRDHIAAQQPVRQERCMRAPVLAGEGGRHETTRTREHAAGPHTWRCEGDQRALDWASHAIQHVHQQGERAGIQRRSAPGCVETGVHARRRSGQEVFVRADIALSVARGTALVHVQQRAEVVCAPCRVARVDRRAARQ